MRKILTPLWHDTSDDDGDDDNSNCGYVCDNYEIDHDDTDIW